MDGEKPVGPTEMIENNTIVAVFHGMALLQS